MSVYSLFVHCSFDATKNRLDCYRGKDCKEMFCEDLKKHSAKIINYVKKEIVPLPVKERDSYHKNKLCHICKKGFSTDDDNKKYQKSLQLSNNGSTYNYHFIIKELVEEFEGQFECLGQNTEKYITFSVSNIVLIWIVIMVEQLNKK